MAEAEVAEAEAGWGWDGNFSYRELGRYHNWKRHGNPGIFVPKDQNKIYTMAKLYVSSTCVWCNSLSFFARNTDFYLNIPLESIKY